MTDMQERPGGGTRKRDYEKPAETFIDRGHSRIMGGHRRVQEKLAGESKGKWRLFLASMTEHWRKERTVVGGRSEEIG